MATAAGPQKIVHDWAPHPVFIFTWSYLSPLLKFIVLFLPALLFFLTLLLLFSWVLQFSLLQPRPLKAFASDFLKFKLVRPKEPIWAPDYNLKYFQFWFRIHQDIQNLGRGNLRILPICTVSFCIHDEYLEIHSSYLRMRTFSFRDSAACPYR